MAVTQLPPAAHASRFVYASRLLLSGVPGRWLNAWANWDGQWYLKISRLGYTTRQSSAFFPLYPLFVRVLAPLFAHSSLIAGVALSVAFFVAAMYLLYRLIVIDYGPRVAAWTVIFASLFPTSFYFQAVYTESLFLLTTVACLFFARREQWLWAGLAGFCAALTRNTGVLLLLPMAMFYFGARDGKLRRLGPPAGLVCPGARRPACVDGLSADQVRRPLYLPDGPGPLGPLAERTLDHARPRAGPRRRGDREPCAPRPGDAQARCPRHGDHSGCPA